MSHNISDGLNFVTCEQTFKMIANDHHNPIELITQLQAKLKEKIQYEDLAGEEDTGASTGGPALRLTKMDRYLHGPTPVSAMQYKTSDDVLRAHQRVMHDMLAWKPDLSQVGHMMCRIFSTPNSSCGKVMFSQVSVILSIGGGRGYEHVQRGGRYPRGGGM